MEDSTAKELTDEEFEVFESNEFFTGSFSRGAIVAANNKESHYRFAIRRNTMSGVWYELQPTGGNENDTYLLKSVVADFLWNSDYELVPVEDEYAWTIIDESPYRIDYADWSIPTKEYPVKNLIFRKFSRDGSVADMTKYADFWELAQWLSKRIRTEQSKEDDYD